MKDQDDGAWFAAKRFGFGAGLPVARAGWALLGAIVAGIAIAGRFLPGPVSHGVVALIVIASVPVILARTRGGVRWRWGGPDR